jgi:N-acetylmuramic acid 6-phosphate etherase
MKRSKKTLEFTEQRNPNSMNIDKKSTSKILRIINAGDKKVPIAVEKEIPNIVKAVNIITGTLRKGGSLFYIGAGTSGRLGFLDATEIPPTYGTDFNLVQGIIAGGCKALWRSVEGVEDNMKAGIGDLLAKGFTSKDVLVGLSASGKTPYVVATLKEARKIGGKTIAIACSPDSEIVKIADIAITPLVGPEVVAGSTRMKCGTAQKLVLNMLSTTTMINLGKVCGNLMIELKPTSRKLKERAKRIIMMLTGADYDTADRVFNDAQENTKAAIVMIKTKVTYEKATKALRKACGRVWKAVDIAQSQ